MQMTKDMHKDVYKSKFRDFPGGPAVKTLRSQCRGPSSIPGRGTRSRMPQLRACRPQLRPNTAK